MLLIVCPWKTTGAAASKYATLTPVYGQSSVVRECLWSLKMLVRGKKGSLQTIWEGLIYRKEVRQGWRWKTFPAPALNISNLSSSF